MKSPIKAIKTLVDYLYTDEEKDFASYCDDNGRLIDKSGRTHIFQSVREVGA
jgi:hypothetical protein